MSASNQPSNDKLFVARALEAAIRIGPVFLILYWCFKIGQPFIETIAWGIIIAVAIHPGYDRLKSAKVWYPAAVHRRWCRVRGFGPCWC